MFTKKTIFYLSFAFVFLFVGCKSSENNKKENATGNLGTLTIVADAETHNALKATYDEVFLTTKTNHALTEPFNQIQQPDIEDFSKFFYNQRTLLVLVTEKNYKDLDEVLSIFKKDEIKQFIASKNITLRVASNVLAKNQEILYLFGKNTEDVKLKLINNQTAIVNILLKNEITAQAKALETDSTGKLYAEMKTAYGIGVNIPTTFMLKIKKPDFYLFQMDNKTDANNPISIGLIVQTYPYTDTTDFNYVNIRTHRDTACKYNMAGDIAGTFMSTSESDYYPVRTKENITLNGYRASKIGAWWTVKGLSMSGPFLRYAVHVPEKNLIFAFEGFVNKPNLNFKDKDIRLIEAIAQSIH